MQLLDDLKNAIPVKMMVIALAIFFVGQLAIHSLLVSPRQELKHALSAKQEELTETYIQLKSADMHDLVDMLDTDVTFVRQKQDNLFAKTLTREQIPFLVSTLEREAEAAGLHAVSNVKGIEKHKSLQNVVIDLSFSGSFHNIMKFINLLHRDQSHLLIQDFNIEGRAAESSELSGQLRLISLLVGDETS